MLRTSPQTVRNYLRQKILRGRIDSKTKKWLVQRASVQNFLAVHGPLDGGRRRKSPTALLEAKVEQLTAEVARLSGLVGLGDSQIAAIVSERDDLRARVVALEDTLAKMRDAADLKRSADAERDEVVGQLLAALHSANRAEGLRRQALESLEGALAGSMMPGHAGSIR
jgi:hypothetical protein